MVAELVPVWVTAGRPIPIFGDELTNFGDRQTLAEQEHFKQKNS